MNLCKLTKDEQDAIEQDKALWLKAHDLIRLKPRSAIKAILLAIPCEIERNDLRDRLNQTVAINKTNTK